MFFTFLKCFIVMIIVCVTLCLQRNLSWHQWLQQLLSSFSWTQMCSLVLSFKTCVISSVRQPQDKQTMIRRDQTIIPWTTLVGNRARSKSPICCKNRKPNSLIECLDWNSHASLTVSISYWHLSDIFYHCFCILLFPVSKCLQNNIISSQGG